MRRKMLLNLWLLLMAGVFVWSGCQALEQPFAGQTQPTVPPTTQPTTGSNVVGRLDALAGEVNQLASNQAIQATSSTLPYGNLILNGINLLAIGWLKVRQAAIDTHGQNTAAKVTTIEQDIYPTATLPVAAPALVTAPK